MKMTKKEKRILARRWTAELKERMLGAIDQAPPEWDGIELRHLFADLAAEVSAIDRFGLTPGRRNEYESDRIVHNI